MRIYSLDEERPIKIRKFRINDEYLLIKNKLSKLLRK